MATKPHNQPSNPGSVTDKAASVDGRIQRKTLSALILAALTPGPYQASAQRVYWGLNSTLTVSLDERTEQMIRDISTLAVNHCDPAKRKALAAELLAFRERYGQEDMPEPLQQDAPK
jgi:hypothetical protein